MDTLVILGTFFICSVALVRYHRHLVVKRQAELVIAIITALNTALIDGIADGIAAVSDPSDRV